MLATPRRQQRRIAIASDRAFDRLKLLTRDGRSQVSVIEEALERMPVPKDEESFEQFMADIKAIQARVPKRDYPTMAEIDAEFWDEEGLPR
jgi:hypothetical protein